LGFHLFAPNERASAVFFEHIALTKYRRKMLKAGALGKKIQHPGLARCQTAAKAGMLKA
jgi:hypothetical protein